MNLSPGKLCRHCLYTTDGDPDCFFIYPNNFKELDDYNLEYGGQYLYAQDIFLFLEDISCNDSNGISQFKILTSAGFVGIIMVHAMYDDMFHMIGETH